MQKNNYHAKLMSTGKGAKQGFFCIVTVDVINSAQGSKDFGRFIFAHFPALRVTRRGESVMWVVSPYPNRPLAKRILTPAMCDRTGLAKINPDAAYTKSPKETGAQKVQGLPLYASLFLGGLV